MRKLRRHIAYGSRRGAVVFFKQFAKIRNAVKADDLADLFYGVIGGEQKYLRVFDFSGVEKIVYRHAVVLFEYAADITDGIRIVRNDFRNRLIEFFGRRKVFCKFFQPTGRIFLFILFFCLSLMGSIIIAAAAPTTSPAAIPFANSPLFMPYISLINNTFLFSKTSIALLLYNSKCIQRDECTSEDNRLQDIANNKCLDCQEGCNQLTMMQCLFL